ncbi:hypothetical protein [Armatimonas sp.]|uniref:hypothetical protein n=1 Tax=Armatimonas sp. TaxID=1872638 RepID=UPI00374D77FA
MSNSQHPLEIEYGLSALELLDALQARFRARVTLEGAVAEVQLTAHLTRLQYEGGIARFESHDEDGKHDFTLHLPEDKNIVRIECKNVRNSKRLQVEIQKTRASKNDPSSRYYDASHFEIIAVCLGKKTRNWKQFFFASAADLSHHKEYPEKLAVMHSLPASGNADNEIWFSDLRTLLRKKFPAS